MRAIHVRAFSAALLLTAVGVFIFGSSASADQTFYIGPNNGLWSTGSNWDAGVQPAPGDDAVVGQFVPNRNGDVNVNFDADYSAGGRNSLMLDATGISRSVILNQTTTGTYMQATNETIGASVGTSVYNHSAGTNTISNFVYLGSAPMAGGTYNLSGGAAFSTNYLYVGNSGTERPRNRAPNFPRKEQRSSCEVNKSRHPNGFFIQTILNTSSDVSAPKAFAAGTSLYAISNPWEPESAK
jgi:hypothetical protein